MADLVRDDVVGQRRVQRGASRQGRHPSEEDGVVLARVVRVPSHLRLGDQEQLVVARVPRDRPAEVSLEQRQGAGRDGVDVLRAELPDAGERDRVGVRVGAPGVAVGPGVPVGEHDRVGSLPAADVEVDHVETLPARAAREAPGGHRNRDQDGAVVVDDARVLGHDRHRHGLLLQERPRRRGPGDASFHTRLLWSGDPPQIRRWTRAMQRGVTRDVLQRGAVVPALRARGHRRRRRVHRRLDDADLEHPVNGSGRD